jgi:hypothetical protein
MDSSDSKQPAQKAGFFIALSSLLKNIFRGCHSDPAVAGEESRSEKSSNARFLVGRRGDLLGMTRLGGGEFLNKLFDECSRAGVAKCSRHPACTREVAG